jgi:hypothetical protein
MRLLPDPLLYTDSRHCLARMREWQPSTAARSLERIPVHFYWAGPFGAKQALSIKSFLATHNPALSECWLWLDTQVAVQTASANPHLAPLLPLIHLRCFCLDEEILGTPFQGCDWVRGALRPAYVSDIARLAILHNHGGIYADIDTLFLRDIDGLRACIDDVECAYRWSYVPRAANAWLRLRARGPVVVDLMLAANAARSAHANPMLSFDRRLPGDFIVLPAAAFSPLWLHVDGKEHLRNAPLHRFSDFFRRFGWFFRHDPAIRSSSDFFPGAYAYHWHNLWNAAEHADSYAGLFDAEFNDRLHNRHPGLAPLARFGVTPSIR